MSRLQMIPGLAFLDSEPLRTATLREEPDWALVERITGKKCPENVNLRSLSRMTDSELVRTLGLSDTQGKKLSAALTLASRLAHEGIERGETIRTGEDVYRIFAGRMRDAKKESFCAVTLDQKHKIIDIHRISEGTLSMTPVHPREAFNPVIRDHAAAVIFVHNHPSGNPEPSSDDLSLTGRLVESGNILGVRVLDHIVVGDGEFVSLRNRGLACFQEKGQTLNAAECASETGAAGESGPSSPKNDQEAQVDQNPKKLPTLEYRNGERQVDGKRTPDEELNGHYLREDGSVEHFAKGRLHDPSPGDPAVLRPDGSFSHYDNGVMTRHVSKDGVAFSRNERGEYAREDPGPSRTEESSVTFRLGPKNLEHTEITLPEDDWKAMVGNAGKGEPYHLLHKTETGLTRLERSFKNTDAGRFEALKERSRLEETTGDGQGPRFSVIAHEHFEDALRRERKTPEKTVGRSPAPSGSCQSSGKTRTFLVGPRDKTVESPAPDYSGLVVIGKTPHKVDLWKDGRIQIARKESDRYASVGEGRLKPAGPDGFSGPVPVLTAPGKRTSVEMGIRGIGSGSPVLLSVSEGRETPTPGKNRSITREKGINR